MDMLPKVLFTISKPFNKPIVKTIDFHTSKVFDSGIEVSDYSTVHVKLETEHDSETILLIESYENEEIIKIRANDDKVLIISGKNSENMLVPGIYHLNIISNNKKYSSYYKVRSNDFSDESLINLKSYLEKILSGLSYDILKKRMGSEAAIPILNPNLLQFLQFINKNKNKILFNLESIKEDPIINLIGVYSIQKQSKKPDGKSLRWQAQNRGTKNMSLINPKYYYEKHTQTSHKNIENQWIKFIIKFFLQSLRKLERSLNTEKEERKKKLNFQKEELLKNKKLLSVERPFGYEKSIGTLRKKEKRILGRIEELLLEQVVYSGHIQLIRQIAYLFYNTTSISWIQLQPDIKPNKVTHGLLKDPRYRSMYKLYRELSLLESKSLTSIIPEIQNRRTWELFEYYNVGLVIDILIQNGYEWVSGWLADKESPYQNIGSLPSDTTLKFHIAEDDHYIEVIYDGELESNPVDTGYSRYFNNKGRRPDILITIYNKDGSIYSDRAGLIIESKCRRHQYLINKKIDPDVKEQLIDFKKLEYFDSNASENGGDSVRTPIKQVIVLYPKQNGREPVLSDHIYGEGIVYIQIEPSNPNEEEKPFGYTSLKQKVDQYLSQVKERRNIYA